jgi:hypothetical protein
VKNIKYTIPLAMATLLLFAICCNKVNTPKRNTITFKSHQNDVEVALKNTTQLLSGLPFELKNNTYYFLDNKGQLYIDRKSFGDINTVLKYHDIRGTKFNSEDDFIIFINMVIFLNDNHINSASKCFETNTIIYNYRYIYLNPLASNMSDDRFLVFNSDISDSNTFFTTYKLLDRKGELMLVALIELKDRKDRDKLNLPY